MRRAPDYAIFYQNAQLFERSVHDLESVFLFLQERMEEQGQVSAVSHDALQCRAYRLPEADRGQRIARSRQDLPKTAEARQVVVSVDQPPLERQDDQAIEEADAARPRASNG